MVNIRSIRATWSDRLPVVPDRRQLDLPRSSIWCLAALLANDDAGGATGQEEMAVIGEEVT